MLEVSLVHQRHHQILVNNYHSTKKNKKKQREIDNNKKKNSIQAQFYTVFYSLIFKGLVVLYLKF